MNNEFSILQQRWQSKGGKLKQRQSNKIKIYSEKQMLDRYTLQNSKFVYNENKMIIIIIIIISRLN